MSPGRCWSNLGKFGRIGSRPGNYGGSRSISGQVWSKSNQAWSMSGQVWPTLANLGRSRPDSVSFRAARADVGQCWCRSWPMLVQPEPMLIDAGQMLVEVGRIQAKFGRSWAEAGQTWQNSAQHRSNSTQIWPTPDNISRCWSNVAQSGAHRFGPSPPRFVNFGQFQPDLPRAGQEVGLQCKNLHGPHGKNAIKSWHMFAHLALVASPGGHST